jgi:glycosidase
MGINIRAKGQIAEREIANELNTIINAVLTEMNVPIPDKPIIQRNQNQSAVGGNDLTNVFGLSIEVKRQEQLAINTWWKQCVKSAERNEEIPVLIFRQNQKDWRVVMIAWLNLPKGRMYDCRIEMQWEDFKIWFYLYVKGKLEMGAAIPQ